MVELAPLPPLAAWRRRIDLADAIAQTIQGYNAQAAVDAVAQIIVAHTVVAGQSDQDPLVPLIDDIARTFGRRPDEGSPLRNARRCLAWIPIIDSSRMPNCSRASANELTSLSLARLMRSRTCQYASCFMASRATRPRFLSSPRSKDETERDTLLGMARQWERLAEHKAKIEAGRGPSKP